MYTLDGSSQNSSKARRSKPELYSVTHSVARSASDWYWFFSMADPSTAVLPEAEAARHCDCLVMQTAHTPSPPNIQPPTLPIQQQQLSINHNDLLSRSPRSPPPPPPLPQPPPPAPRPKDCNVHHVRVPFRILTVGDGDLTLSRALVRSFHKNNGGFARCVDNDTADNGRAGPFTTTTTTTKGNHSCCNSNKDYLGGPGWGEGWELTATTLLPNAHELMRTYPKTAPGVLRELVSLSPPSSSSSSSSSSSTLTPTTLVPLQPQLPHAPSNLEQQQQQEKQRHQHYGVRRSSVDYENDDHSNTCDATTKPCRTDPANSHVTVLYGIDATQLHRHFGSAAAAAASSIADDDDDDGNDGALDTKKNKSPSLLPSRCATVTDPNQQQQQQFNAILFHHPHLGLFDTEQEQVLQHQRLLAHYLWSASQCLVVDDDSGREQQRNSEMETTTTSTTTRRRRSETTKEEEEERQTRRSGIVHVCLCGNQAETWQLRETCQRLGLQIVAQESTTKPFDSAVLNHADFPKTTTVVSQSQPPPPPPPPRKEEDDDNDDDKEVEEENSHKNNDNSHDDDNDTRRLQPQQQQQRARGQRRDRYGKHCNNRHWLVQYGYQHQRTQGEILRRSQSRVNLEGSKHYIMRVAEPQRQRRRIHSPWSRRKQQQEEEQEENEGGEAASRHACFVCNICRATFHTWPELLSHLRQPAIPKPPPPPQRETSTTPSPASALSVTRDDEEEEEREQEINSNMQENFYKEVVPWPSTLSSKNRTIRANPGAKAAAAAAAVSPPCRLRKYVQTHFGLSKQQANRLIAQGQVCLNEQVITDSARHVPVDALVTLRPGAEASAAVSPNQEKTAVVDRPMMEIAEQEISPTYCSSLVRGVVEIEILDRCSLFLPSSPSSTERRLEAACPATTTSPLSRGGTSIPVVVVWKPVGMRCLGQFGGNNATALTTTLEALVTQQLATAPAVVVDSSLSSSSAAADSCHNHKLYYYHCWNRLDTGCSGLCVLAGSTPQPPNHNKSLKLSLSASHLHHHHHGKDSLALLDVKCFFTVLVHGHVPDHWTLGQELELPLHWIRQWKTRQPQPPARQPTTTTQPHQAPLQRNRKAEIIMTTTPNDCTTNQEQKECHDDDHEDFDDSECEEATQTWPRDSTPAPKKVVPSPSSSAKGNDTRHSMESSTLATAAAALGGGPVASGGVENTISLDPPVLKVRVILLEKTTDPNGPQLSTLCVEAIRTVSGIAGLISHGLRRYRNLEDDQSNDATKKKTTKKKDDDDDETGHSNDDDDSEGGYRVVGDRFSREWDAQRLPRAMRYRLKHRLCMAVTSVQVTSSCGDIITEEDKMNITNTSSSNHHHHHQDPLLGDTLAPEKEEKEEEEEALVEKVPNVPTRNASCSGGVSTRQHGPTSTSQSWSLLHKSRKLQGPQFQKTYGYSRSIPDKLKATYWQMFLQNGRSSSGVSKRGCGGGTSSFP